MTAETQQAAFDDLRDQVMFVLAHLLTDGTRGCPPVSDEKRKAIADETHVALNRLDAALTGDRTNAAPDIESGHSHAHARATGDSSASDAGQAGEMIETQLGDEYWEYEVVSPTRSHRLRCMLPERHDALLAIARAALTLDAPVYTVNRAGDNQCVHCHRTGYETMALTHADDCVGVRLADALAALGEAT